MKLIKTFMALAAAAWLLPSCGTSHTPTGPVPVGTMIVNGAAWTGSVSVGSVRIFTLGGITKGDTYLLRTTIAPGGTLFASIYTSYSAYLAGETPVTTAVAVVPDFYEAFFQAKESGDYVVVISGTAALTAPANSPLNFYQLRIMSATGAALKSFTTSTFPSVVAMATGTIFPDTLHVYSDSTTTPIISPPGTYTVLLTSPTATISHPQMFIYGDTSLSLASLLYSAVVETHNGRREFHISTFASKFSTTPTISTFPSSSFFSTQCAVTTVSFPTTTAGGPFIEVRGVNQARYTLSVSH